MEGFWPKTSDEYMARLFTQYFSTTLFDDQFKQVTDDMLQTYPRHDYEEQVDLNSS